MDINILYTSSPDWIKALMVILPHATLMGVAWLVFRGPAPPPPPAPAAKVTSNPVLEVLPAPVRLDLALSELDMRQK